MNDKLNSDWLIYDGPDRKTINGLPAGLLAPRPRILMGNDEGTAIDLHKIIEYFHPPVDGKILCAYSGKPANGIRALDGSIGGIVQKNLFESNFLITNLEPVNQEFFSTLEMMPTETLTKVFRTRGTDVGDIDVELSLEGLPLYSIMALEQANFPLAILMDFPPHVQPIVLWKFLTHARLLKGLTKISIHNRTTDLSVSLTNRAVMEFVVRTLQLDPKEN